MIKAERKEKRCPKTTRTMRSKETMTPKKIALSQKMHLNILGECQANKCKPWQILFTCRDPAFAKQDTCTGTTRYDMIDTGHISVRHNTEPRSLYRVVLHRVVPK